MDFEADLDRDLVLDDSVVIVAFPTAGLVGPIAASYLVENLDLERVGHVHSDLYPAATIVRDGRASTPIRVYAGELACGPGEDCTNLVVLASEVPPPDGAHVPLGRAILDWAADARHRIVLESMDVDGEPAHRVEGVSSTDGGCSLLEDYDIHCLEDGAISGLAAGIINEGLRRNREVVCLVGAVRDEDRDSAAAAHVVQAVDRIVVEVDFDVEPLKQWASDQEDRMRARIERTRPAGEAPSMYR